MEESLHTVTRPVSDKIGNSSEIIRRTLGMEQWTVLQLLTFFAVITLTTPRPRVHRKPEYYVDYKRYKERDPLNKLYKSAGEQRHEDRSITGQINKELSQEDNKWNDNYKLLDELDKLYTSAHGQRFDGGNIRKQSNRALHLQTDDEWNDIDSLLNELEAALGDNEPTDSPATVETSESPATDETSESPTTKELSGSVEPPTTEKQSGSAESPSTEESFGSDESPSTEEPLGSAESPSTEESSGSAESLVSFAAFIRVVTQRSSPATEE